MTLLDLLILSLTAWRISSLLVNEEGPYSILAEFREIVQPHTNVLSCLWCCSVWVGIGLSAMIYFYPVTIWLMLPLAVSGLAIVVDRWVNG